MNVHIYRAGIQPATRWTPGDIGGKRRWIRWPARRRETCDSCGKRRECRNLGVLAYYDKIDIVCRVGGCAVTR
jgi:hypothetical protein